MTEMHLPDSILLDYAALPTDGYFVIDTETTGLKAGNDEVLQLAITDADGNVLFDHLIRPARRRRWPSAEELHGITWADVKGERELVDYADELDAILGEHPVIVGYNVDFDLEMLDASGYTVRASRSIDLMRVYARAYGRYNDYRGDYAFVKLGRCAERYGVQYDAHDAKADAIATAHCYRAFVNECVAARDAKGEEYWAEHAPDRDEDAHPATDVDKPKGESFGRGATFLVIAVFTIVFAICAVTCVSSFYA